MQKLIDCHGERIGKSYMKRIEASIRNISGVIYIYVRINMAAK